MALALTLLRTPAAGADAAQVTVVTPSGIQYPLSLEALAGSEDVVERGYALRAPGGASTRTVSGFSLAAILEAAGAETFGFSYLEVERPGGGGGVSLSRHQALDPSAFPAGPPVVFAAAGGTGFIRPSAGPEDLNADDCFEAPQGITIVLRKGTQLQVRALAAPTRTRPGHPVSFRTVVSGAGAGQQLSYSWYFDDGHTAGDSPRAQHSFARPGNYDVVVGVTAPGDETGVSAVVTVQVGAPAAGPDRKGGGNDRAAGAPDHGAASGPSGGATAGGGGGSAPAPEAPRPAPAPAAQPAPTRHPRPRPAQPDGERVSGLLLEGPAGETPVTPAPQSAARAGAPTDGGGLPPAAWGALATVGLLGAGALLEAGGGAALLPGTGRRWRTR